MRRITLLLILCILQMTFAMSDFSLEKVRGGYSFELTLPEYTLENIQVEAALADGTPVSGTFTKVLLPGYSANGEIGAPQLLSSSFDIALEDGDAEVTYTVTKVDTVKLTAPLYPKQHTLAGCSDGTLDYFSYDEAKYMAQKVIPVVAVEDYYTFRTQQAVTITVAPMHYNAAAQELYITRSVNVAIEAQEPALVRSANSKKFDSIVRNKFKNLQGTLGASIASEQTRANESYLMIVADKYKTNGDLQRLIDYRKAQYDVEVVDNSSIGGDKDSYRDFIRGKMPTFVLLVGDDSDFPVHSFQFNMGQMITVKSFSYYICARTSGEPSPDIAMGVFLVNSDSDLKNMVNKTITAEAKNKEMPNVYVGVGGNKNQMGSLKPEHCDQVVQQMGTDFFESAGYENIQVYSYLQPNGTKQDIINACNAGARFINYNGHGMQTEWVYGWGNNDLSSLTNSEYFPYVLSCCCYTGTFDMQCMARAYTTSANGPSAFIASYEQSSMGQHPLNYGMYDAIMTKDITKYGLAFVFAANSDIIPTSCQSMPPNQQTTQLMQWQYHLYGDPALETIESPIVEPYITVSAPNGGEVIAIGESTTITWDSNSEDKITIELTGASSVTVAEAIDNNGSYAWDVPEDMTPGDYKVKITAGTLSDESDATFELKKIPVTGNLVKHGDWYVSSDTLEGTHASSAQLDTSKAEEIAGQFTVGESDGKNIWPWASLSCEPGNDLAGVSSFKLTYKSDHDFVFTVNDTLLTSDGVQYGYKLPKATSFTTVVITLDMLTQPDWISDAQKADLRLENALSVSFNPEDAYGKSTEICINNFQLYNFKGKKEAVVDAGILKSGAVLSVVGLTSKKLSLIVPQKGLYEIALFTVNGKKIVSKKTDLNAGLSAISLRSDMLANQMVILSICGADQQLNYKQYITQ